MTNYAISALGNTPMYGMPTFNYNDQYFWQAYNSPNANSYMPQNPQTTAVTTPSPAATTGTTSTTATSPTFEGASVAFQGQDKKSNSVAKCILGLGAVAATAWAGYKCFKTGNGQGLAKVWNGVQQYWNKGIDIISKWKFNLSKNPIALLPENAASLIGK